MGSKLFKVSTTFVTLPEKHVKHVSESENLRGRGSPNFPYIPIHPPTWPKSDFHRLFDSGFAPSAAGAQPPSEQAESSLCKGFHNRS